MAACVTLANCTDQGIRPVKQSLEHQRQAKERLRQLEGTFASESMTVGQCDDVLVWEALDDGQRSGFRGRGL